MSPVLSCMVESQPSALLSPSHTKLMVGCQLASVAQVFAVCPTLVALVEPLLVRFQQAESAAEPVCESCDSN